VLHAELPVDRYNAPNTMKINGNIYIGMGTKLYSDRRRCDADSRGYVRKA